jgi:hypothetical protein
LIPKSDPTGKTGCSAAASIRRFNIDSDFFH